MAIKEVEGSKFNEELTGSDLLDWIMVRCNITRDQAIKNMAEAGITVEED